MLQNFILEPLTLFQCLVENYWKFRKYTRYTVLYIKLKRNMAGSSCNCVGVLGGQRAIRSYVVGELLVYWRATGISDYGVLT